MAHGRVALLLSLVAGCAHHSQFTSAEELQQLALGPKPARLFSNKAVDVERFELTTPLAEPGAPHESKSPWAGLLFGQPGAAPDGSLGCAAQQLARFGVEHDGSPSQSLTAFVVGACGGQTAHVTTNTLRGQVDAAITDEKLFADWSADVRKMLAELKPGDRAGIAIARADGKAWLTLLKSHPVAHLTSTARIPGPDGTVTLEGAVESPTERVEALVNQGAIGWARCTRDEKVALPAFRFSCPTLKDDAAAWAEVSAWEPKRLLGREVARALLFPSGTPLTVYTRGTSAPVAAATAEALVTGLNAVRTGARLPALKLEPSESATAAAVAPFFFGESDGPVSDKIALGLMAGWEVDGLLHSGNFFAAGSAQADALLTGMLESPGGRQTLLDPKATRVAAGLVSNENASGVLISTYEPMPTVDPNEAPKQLIVKLNEARAKLGKLPAQWMVNAGDFYVRASKALLSNEWSPEDAAHAFMTDTLGITHRPVRGSWQTTSDLDQLTWSEEVLQHPAPQVLIFVGVQRESGEPWARYVVLVLLLEEAPGTQA